MKEIFSLISGESAQQLAVAEIISCNRATSRYGLVLKESEAIELAETRSEALKGLGRIEFAGGTINKLIMAFCDSPYLDPSNYAETLNELLEIFYHFKNETLDEIDDDELISQMKKSFDQTCRGSVDLLKTRDLFNLSRRVRFGIGMPDGLTEHQEDLAEDLEGIFEENTGGEISEEERIINEDFDDYLANPIDSYMDLYRYYRRKY